MGATAFHSSRIGSYRSTLATASPWPTSNPCVSRCPLPLPVPLQTTLLPRPLLFRVFRVLCPCRLCCEQWDHVWRAVGCNAGGLWMEGCMQGGKRVGMNGWGLDLGWMGIE